MEKRLKALPDFGNAGVWVDDDTVEVTEALGPIKEVNGSEAKFLLRFLFKRAAMFRESDVKAATQVRARAGRFAACAARLARASGAQRAGICGNPGMVRCGGTTRGDRLLSCQEASYEAAPPPSYEGVLHRL